MHFNKLAEGEGGEGGGEEVEEFFLERGASLERSGQFLEEDGLWVFRDSNYKFYFTTLIDLRLRCRLKDVVSLVIFYLLCFSLISFY